MMPLPAPRLSCLPVSLYAALGDGSLDLAGWFALAREAGLDGADLSVATGWPGGAYRVAPPSEW